MTLLPTLPVPKISYYGNDVPALGGSSDDMIWENGALMTWENATNILWESAAGNASADIFHVFSYPTTSFGGSI